MSAGHGHHHPPTDILSGSWASPSDPVDASASSLDPQLDPSQHRRRALPPQPRPAAPAPAVQGTCQTQPPDGRAGLCRPPEASATASGTPAPYVHGGTGRTRVSLRPEPDPDSALHGSGPGPPAPGSVQDQSSGALLLPPLPAPAGPSRPAHGLLPACSQEGLPPVAVEGEGHGPAFGGYDEGPAAVPAPTLRLRQPLPALRLGLEGGPRAEGDACGCGQRPLDGIDTTAAGAASDPRRGRISVRLLPVWEGQRWTQPTAPLRPCAAQQAGAQPSSLSWAASDVADTGLVGTEPPPAFEEPGRGGEQVPGHERGEALAAAGLLCSAQGTAAVFGQAAGDAAGVQAPSGRQPAVPAVLLPSPTAAAVAAAAGALARVGGAPRGRGSAGAGGGTTFVRAPGAAEGGGGGGGRGLGAGGDEAARILMAVIMRCRNWRQLQALLHEYGSTAVNAFHVAAALKCLSRMQLPAPEGGGGEVQAFLSELEATFRQLLTASWAQARTAPPAPPGGPRSGGMGQPHGPRGPGVAAEPSRPQLGPRQLANCLAALAQLRDGGWRLAEDRWLLHLAAAAAARWRLETFPPQELTTLLYAVAKLGHRPSPRWLEGACEAVAAAASTRRLSPRQLATCLWALAVMRWRPSPAFLAAWLAASYEAMPYFSPYDVSQSLWALASLYSGGEGIAAGESMSTSPGAAKATAARLPPHWVAAALGRCRQVLRPGRCAPQDVALAMWGVARLGLAAPPGWAEGVAAALLAAAPTALEACRPVDVGLLMWALAALRARPPPTHMARLLRAAARLGAAGRLAEQDMANVLGALGSLRYQPPPHVLRALGRRLAQLLTADGGGEVAAAAVQGRRAHVAGPAAAQARPPPLAPPGPQLIATALWACVRLQLDPGSRLMGLMVAAARRRAAAFGPHSAALMLYGIARATQLGWLAPAEGDAGVDGAGLRRPAAPPLAPLLEAALQRMAGVELGAPAADADGGPPTGTRAATEAAVGREQERGGEGEACPPRSLPVMLWSLAALSFQPGEEAMRGLLVHSVEVLPRLSAREAGVVAASLAALRYRPPPLWLERMERLLDQHAAQAPAQAQAQGGWGGGARPTAATPGAAAARGPAAAGLGPAGPWAPPRSPRRWEAAATEPGARAADLQAPARARVSVFAQPRGAAHAGPQGGQQLGAAAAGGGVGADAGPRSEPEVGLAEAVALLRAALARLRRKAADPEQGQRQGQAGRRGPAAARAQRQARKRGGAAGGAESPRRGGVRQDAAPGAVRGGGGRSRERAERLVLRVGKTRAGRPRLALSRRAAQGRGTGQAGCVQGGGGELLARQGDGEAAGWRPSLGELAGGEARAWAERRASYVRAEDQEAREVAVVAAGASASAHSGLDHWFR
ncbi:hypothetical protein HYH03_004306 [Edaphochlamys debaryana]|uniref:Uncharacterized protein n=1 Tax=Edaphochlamys debaryana TaxID=47281 RepID=A0A836C279_9CHLO|nr:hypothetical protein HYH03_004306 [Edaphochlamys debaryana]|eukprot:KAG2497560.1 hypothetical protein HYH03_004306 [Edaphochlamys debaryana]